ncbi:hypothetical protein RJT34_04104 [Clitoria ternatea]|uniref:Uncharacterized protein n=1 Tax=Clitoria ternatea TaxID=43366 RepID=A0AAN9Q5S4_CLITE
MGEDGEMGKMMKLNCCTDNNIGHCNPGSSDDQNCNNLCMQQTCGKGGLFLLLLFPTLIVGSVSTFSEQCLLFYIAKPIWGANLLIHDTLF